jgi:hypothetical protein
MSSKRGGKGKTEANEKTPKKSQSTHRRLRFAVQTNTDFF